MDTLKTRYVINIPLRPGKDDDIFNALNAMPASIEKSDIGRAALRLWFGLSEKQLLLPLPGAVDKAQEARPEAIKKHSEKKMPVTLEPIAEVKIEQAGESKDGDLNDDLDSYLGTFSTG